MAVLTGRNTSRGNQCKLHKLCARNYFTLPRARLQTDRRTDGQGDSSIPPNFGGGGYNYISFVLPTGFRTFHLVSFLYVFFLFFFFCFVSFLTILFSFFCVSFFRFFSLLFSLFSFRFFFLSVSFRFFRFSVYRHPDYTQLRTDFGQSVGVTTTIQLVWLNQV